MTIRMPTSRRFVPGTTGWTEDDLNDPRIEKMWERGRYEIIEGVLTKMPAAYLEGSLPLRSLVRQVERYLEQNAVPGKFGFEVDLVVNQIRVPKVDAVFLTLDQLYRQAAIQARRKKQTKLRYGRLRVAPELVIESISLGHELHDRETKREWYRGFGIRHYWLFDPYRRTLECLKLADEAYQMDSAGKEQEYVTPSLFPGLTIQLSEVWI